MLEIHTTVYEETHVSGTGFRSIVHQRRRRKRETVFIEELLPKRACIATISSPIRPTAHPEIQAVGGVDLIVKADITARIKALALIGIGVDLMVGENVILVK